MLIPSPEVFENFIAVNNTFAIGKGDNRKKNSKDETTITPRSFNFIIRNTMNVIRDRYYQPKIIFSFGTGNWWEGGITAIPFFYRNDDQRQRPAIPGRRIYAPICTVTGGARCDLWPGKLFRRDSRHSVIHRCGTRLMTQLLRQASLFARQRVASRVPGNANFSEIVGTKRLMEHLKIQCDKIYAMTHRGLLLFYWNSYSESKIVAL